MYGTRPAPLRAAPHHPLNHFPVIAAEVLATG